MRPRTERERRAVALLGFCPSRACPTTTPGPVYREDTRRTGHPRKTPLRSGRRNRASTPRPRLPEPGGEDGWPPAPRAPTDAGRARAPSRRRPFLPCPPPATDSVSCPRGPDFGGLRDVMVDRSSRDRSSPLGFLPARRVWRREVCATLAYRFPGTAHPLARADDSWSTSPRACCPVTGAAWALFASFARLDPTAVGLAVGDREARQVRRDRKSVV